MFHPRSDHLYAQDPCKFYIDRDGPVAERQAKQCDAGDTISRVKTEPKLPTTAMLGKMLSNCHDHYFLMPEPIIT